MKRLSFALAVLALAVPSWAQRAAGLYTPAYITDDEGSKLVASSRSYATESSLIPTTHGCGASSSTLTHRFYFPYIDLNQFGGSGTIGTANGNPAVQFSVAGTYSQYLTCPPPGIPDDADYASNQFNLVDQITTYKGWAGRYEVQWAWVGAPLLWSSTGNATRNSAGCYHYVPPVATTGTIQIIVQLENGSPSSKVVSLRHPAVVGGNRFGEFNLTISGTRTMQLPTGRTLDFSVVSGQWNVVTVPAYGASPNKYYVTVDGGGTVVNVSGAESNQPAGSSYDGPPGESSWWTDMLSDAFLPTEPHISAWEGMSETARSWGPFGYVSTFFSLFNSGGYSPGADNYMIVRMSGPVDGAGMSTAMDFSFDFRDQSVIPQPDPLPTPPYSRGTFYGQLRAYLRLGLGLGVWGLGAVGLYRWLRPKQQV